MRAVGILASGYNVPVAGGNIGYRSFNGTSSDTVKVNLGNLASTGHSPGTWMFAGRTTAFTADTVIAATVENSYDPLDFFLAASGNDKYGYYDGAVNNVVGPTVTVTVGVDVIVTARLQPSSALKWSIATHNGTSWSTFTHTATGAANPNRSFPASGLITFSTSANPYTGRMALFAHCNTSISDTEVGTLTTAMSSWQALASLTNLWRFDQTPVVDLKGTATQNTLTGTTVTAGGFPLPS
jgi:hypothetical protein